MGYRYATTLPLEVFTQRNFVAHFFDWNWIFWKTNKSLFQPLFRVLRGNVRTSSIARWKARSRLHIRHSWTFFAVSYGRDVVSGCLSKSAFFEGGGSVWEQISDGKGRCPPTTVGVSKLQWLRFRVVSKYQQCIVWFCHKARVWRTGRQTDGQT